MPLLLPRLAKCGGGVFPDGCPGGVPWQSWPGVLAGCRGASFLAGWSGRVSWEAVLAWRGWGKSRKSHKSPEIVDFAEPTPFPEELTKSLELYGFADSSNIVDFAEFPPFTEAISEFREALGFPAFPVSGNRRTPQKLQN